MKNVLVILLVIIISANAKAQLIVRIPNAIVTKGTKIDPRTFKAFKATTTVYFYSEKDEDSFKNYQDVIKESWTITPIIFAPAEDAKKYVDHGKYSFLTLDITTKIKTMSSGTPVVGALWIHLNLEVPQKKKGQFTDVARLIVGPHVKDIAYISQNYFDDLTIKKEWIGEDELSGESLNDMFLAGSYLYSKTNFTNLTPGLLKFYLKEMNDKLSKNETSGLLDEVENLDELRQLKTKTLIVPAEMLDEYKIFKGTVIRNEPEEFMKNYDFNYEIIPLEEINEMLLKKTFPKDSYLLVPAISNTDKYIYIYNAAGEKIYKNVDILDKEFSRSDFKKINKAIEKA